MKCIVIQRRLLGCEHPEAPPHEIASHLRLCSTCRKWQQRLLDLERTIPRLPVPSSTHARARLLEAVQAPAAPSALPPAQPALPLLLARPRPRERARQKLSVALALAASLLLFAIGWWSFPHDAVPPARPTTTHRPDLTEELAEKLQRQLQHAHTPHQRVDTVFALAADVEEQARHCRPDSDKLSVYARFYGKLIRDHLLEDARAMPTADRHVLKDIADHLGKVESEATRRASDPANPEEATASWRAIAKAARDGDRRLRAMTRGERVEFHSAPASV